MNLINQIKISIFLKMDKKEKKDKKKKIRQESNLKK